MRVRSVLITGANRGIGLEFVKQFLRGGHPPSHIFAACRTPEAAEELTQLAVAYPTIHILQMEMTDPTDFDKAAAEVRKFVGSAGLSLLINNAGVFDKTLNDLESHTRENMIKHMDVNVIAPVLITKALFPLLSDASNAVQCDEAHVISAAVINVAGYLGCFQTASLLPGRYPYKYSKAALNMATHCLAEELWKSRILIVGLHPGHVKTDMGGPEGKLTPEESIECCMKVIAELNETHRGKLINWKGEFLQL